MEEKPVKLHTDTIDDIFFIIIYLLLFIVFIYVESFHFLIFKACALD